MLSLSLLAQSKPAADVLITNARVWTGDASQPEVQAVAVLGERIVAVGGSVELQAWRGPKTKVLDARGRRLIPGFNDAHLHLMMGGMELDSVELKSAKSAEEFARRIGERAKQRPGEWVLGTSWDDQGWTPAVLPTRQMIDPRTGDTPVFVSRYDGHMALANSAALRLAGVTKETQAPAGGEIVRDANGEPTGLLKDAAMNLVYKVIPPMTHDQRLRTLKRALAHAAEVGVTSLQDMGTAPEDLNLYAELAERGELTARIYAVHSILRWEEVAKPGLRRAFGSSYLRTGALKGFADGSLGSTTAYFFEPFTDAPHTRGLLSEEMQPPAAMQERMLKADAAGLQLCVHAIGDQGISIILDQFAEVARKNGEADRRMRIEHAQHVAPKDFARFGSQQVIASMQPYHAIDDGRFAERRIGPERIKTTYGFRTFLDNGVRLAFGTDWPVAPLDPLQSVYAAVTRATLDGKYPGGWVPEQKLTVAETLAAYTAGAAYAEFEDDRKGILAPGRLADLVLLSDDIFAIPPEKIREAKVDMTMVGGRVVFARP